MNKTAIITGGSRGIGASTVLSLAKRGVNSIFTYHANEAQAQQIITEAEKLGAQATALPLDIGNIQDFPAFATAVQQILTTWGTEKFDYLVNNAGNSSHVPFTQMTENELDRIYNVHFKGVLFLTQQLLPLMADGGAIINLSSMTTVFGTAGGSAYASMKGAIEVLTRVLAIELAPQKIRVNTVAPSATATDFSGGVVRDNPLFNERVAAGTLLGRVGGPDDIARIITSTLLDLQWVNGEKINASGGIKLG